MNSEMILVTKSKQRMLMKQRSCSKRRWGFVTAEKHRPRNTLSFGGH